MPSGNLFGRRQLAAAGSTGNNTHTAVDYLPGDTGQPNVVAFQFVVEAVGGTPTVTFKYQGSLDNSNWVDLPYISGANETTTQATQAVVAVGVTVNWLSAAHTRAFRYYRCVTTANTNVTYRAEMYAWN